MHDWKEGDDPLEEHAKFFPNCQFLQSVKSSAEAIPDLQSHDELSELTVSNATLFIFRGGVCVCVKLVVANIPEKYIEFLSLKGSTY